MILWSQPGDPAFAPLTRFLSERIWGACVDFDRGTVMAVGRNGQIAGVCLFHNWQPDAGVIELSIASATPRWLSRRVLHEMFAYPFNALSCQLAVMRADPDDARVCRQISAFGFRRFDIPRLRGRSKAEAIFTLGDDEWRAGAFCMET